MSLTKIAFTGDIAFSKYYKEKARDLSIVGDEIADFLNDTDHGVFNVEGAVCDPTHAGQFVHTNDPACIPQLNRLSADIWNLANNHMLDAEAPGCAETIRHAHENGAQTIGAGANIEEASKPVIISSSGGIGILSATRTSDSHRAGKNTAGCFFADETELIKEKIIEIKKTCRWCVMVVHAGKEFCDMPDKDMRKFFRSFLDMGADVIVGHHPHVPQNYEKIGDKYIFYSLGNFIFDTDYQRAQAHTDTGVLLKLFFTEDTVSFEAIGTLIDRSTGHISKAPLPAVFRQLEDKDYAVLEPYFSMRFVEHEKKRFIFLFPEKYKEKGDSVWLDRWEYVNSIYPNFAEIFMRASCYPDIKPGEEYKDLVEYLV